MLHHHITSRWPVLHRPLCLALALPLILPAAHGFVISTSPGLFAPSFRDPLDGDAGQTTSFGWGAAGGRFDGATDDDNVDNPPVTLSPGGLNGTLVQLPSNTEGDGSSTDILSSGNNIYSNPGGAVLSLDVPVAGPVGPGFTTTIIQGRTAFGGYPEGIEDVFGPVAGITPDFVQGINSLGRGQFWAKYEFPGNAGSYSIPITLAVGSSHSIAELIVDTQFSPDGFSSDFATVPEPSGALLLLLAAGLGFRRRR